MVKKKYKPLTAKEKKWNKEFRERMREKGLIPPVKERLNRKKFLEETLEQWKMKKGEAFYYLPKAIGWMVGGGHIKITPEQIGVLKAVKIALEIQAFEERLSKEGKTTYEVGELYEQVIKPILDL